jgi:hypothetical protein
MKQELYTQEYELISHNHKFLLLIYFTISKNILETTLAALSKSSTKSRDDNNVLG